MTNRARIRHLLAALCALLCLSFPARAVAQSVTAQISANRGYLDEPLRVTVRVVNAGEFDGPTFEPAPDLEIKRLPGEQTSSNVTIINGRRSEQRTVSMNFEVLPKRTGALTVPAFTVVAGGVPYSTRPIPITVTESDSGQLLFVRVRASPQTIHVGQRGTLDLEIWARRFTDASLGVTLDEASMWSLVDTQSSSWGVFGPTAQRMFAENRRPRGEIRVEEGTEYIVFTISKPFDPIAAGPPQIGDVRVRMEYPTARQRDRSFFLSSGYALSGSRTLSVTPQPVLVSALPVPEGGRPAAWNGAVGDFELVVVAKPLEVAVGDPITLTMRLTDRSGTAGMEGLQAPPLAIDPAFSTAFRLPPESASGVVEGSSKVFTLSIRALNDAVREIPPVEFAYYDAASGRYESVRSEPIALRVKPSAVVRLEEDAIAGAAPSERQGFTRIEGGLLANASIDDARTLGTVSAIELAIAAGIPCVLGIAPFAIALLRRHDPGAERRAQALAQFTRALDGAASAEAVESALLRYIAARLRVDAGGYSRKDALEGLERAGASAATLAEVERFLRECERARYLGGSVARDEALQVAGAVERETQRRAASAPWSAA